MSVLKQDARFPNGPELRAAAIVVFACIISMSVAGFSIAPQNLQELPDLDHLVPTAFAEWKAQPLPSIVAPTEVSEEEGNVTLYRAYSNNKGDLVTLVVVYGAAKGDVVRLHQPKVCYLAQGYEILSHKKSEVGRIRVSRLVAQRNLGREHVTYWMRVGNRVTKNQVGQQLANISAGLGQAADSTLVRISTNTVQPDKSYAVQDAFITDFLNALTPEMYHLLTASQKDRGS